MSARTATRTAAAATKAKAPESKATTAPKSSPKAKPTESERVATVAGKAPTALHSNFVAWLAANGVAVEGKTPLEMVHLCFDLRMDFQASAANQADLQARRAAAAAKDAAKLEARKAKLLQDAAKLGLSITK